MAIEALSPPPAGDKAAPPKAATSATRSGGRPSPHFANALVDLLGAAGNEDAPATGERTHAKGSAWTEQADPNALLPVPALCGAPVVASAKGGGHPVGGDAGPAKAPDSVRAQVQSVAETLAGVPARGNNSAPAGEGAAVQSLPQAIGADPAGRRDADAPLDPGDNAAPQRAGSVRSGARAAVQRLQAHGAIQPNAPGRTERANVAQGAEVRPGLVQLPQGVRAWGIVPDVAKDTPPVGAVPPLSTLAFANDPGARRGFGAEPRAEQASLPQGGAPWGLSGETAAGERGAGPTAAAEGFAAPVPSEETAVPPRWGMDGGRETQLRIQDMPGGPLDVRVKLSGSEASVGFSSAENATRTALADSSATLSALLSQEGIRLVDVSVQAGLGDSGQHPPPRTPDAGEERRTASSPQASEAPGPVGARAAGQVPRSGTGQLDVFV